MTGGIQVTVRFLQCVLRAFLTLAGGDNIVSPRALLLYILVTMGIFFFGLW